MVTRDERGLTAVLSNVLRIDTPDGTAPGGITDLAVGLVDPGQTERLAVVLRTIERVLLL